MTFFKEVMPLKSKQIALLVQEACEEKKGEDIVILDIRKLSSIADYFVIASGTSDRHVRAIAENVLDRLEQKKIKCTHVEGIQESRWVLLDFSDIIVHVFYPETRRFYSLERLWGEASKFQEPKAKSPKSRKPRKKESK